MWFNDVYGSSYLKNFSTHQIGCLIFWRINGVLRYRHGYVESTLSGLRLFSNCMLRRTSIRPCALRALRLSVWKNKLLSETEPYLCCAGIQRLDCCCGFNGVKLFFSFIAYPVEISALIKNFNLESDAKPNPITTT